MAFMRTQIQTNTNIFLHRFRPFFGCLFTSTNFTQNKRPKSSLSGERKRESAFLSLVANWEKKKWILCAHHFVWTKSFVRIFPFNSRYRWMGAAYSTKARLRKWQYHFIEIFLCYNNNNDHNKSAHLLKKRRIGSKKTDFKTKPFAAI